jgi:hypothetical protein
MSRFAMRVGPLVVLLALAGCAGYHTVDLPWRDLPATGEFATRVDMHEGDLVRVTTTGGRVTAGLLAEVDGLRVTVLDTVGTARLVTVPTDSVRGVEVYQRGGVDNAAKAVLAITGTAATIWIIDDLLKDDPEFVADMKRGR